MVVNRLGTIGGALLLLASGAWCMPSGTVLIRGLRKELNGVEWEVQGDRVKVKTDRGTRWFDMADVELIPDVDSVDRGKPPRLSDEQHRKLQRRLTLAPPDGWVPQQATQPLLAEAYKHPAEQVYLELWITPAGDYEFAKEAGRVSDNRVTEGANDELLLRYAKAQRPTYSWVELGGEILLQGKSKVEVIGSDESWELHELRLRHGGLEFAVAVRVAPKAKLTADEAQALLRCFSFLSPVVESPERYIDHELGFYLLAPHGPWSLLARPFDRERPVRAVRGSEEAVVDVEVVKAGTPQGIADEVVAQHKKQNSGFLDVKALERSTRDGQEVVFYQLHDYPEGRRVLHAFLGLVLRAPGGELLHFRAVADLSTDAPTRETKLLLEGVRFLDGDLAGLDEDLAAARAAAEAQEHMQRKDYAGAIRPLDRCLEVYPGYVPAILLRAEAKKFSGDFEGYREDLELAQEYNPDLEVASGPEAYVEEAKLAERNRDYGQACRSWATAYGKSSDVNHLNAFTRALTQYWNLLKRDTSEDVEDDVRKVEDVAEPVEREEAVKKVLATVYTTAANDFKKEKDWSKAFRYASKLKGLRGDYRDQAEKLREQIKTARERAR
ncbi:MAG: hypothetical protein R3F62_08315 [Planctomycetota bacterium]